jgi:predicted transposase/invertase (TIGR01784 family)
MFETNEKTAQEFSRGDEILMEFNEEVAKASEGSIGEAYDKEWAATEAGKMEGREEGIEQKNIAVIKKLLAKGMPLEEISDIVELPIERIEELKNNNETTK